MVEGKRFRIVIGDSSALIALATCQALHLLDLLADDVYVPRGVYCEVVVQDKPEAQTLSAFLEGRVKEVDIERFVIDAGSLGRGEIEAMAIAKQLFADVLVIDDQRARRIARINRIPVIGSLGILLLAKKEKLTPQIRQFIEPLRRSGLFFAETLLRDVLRIAGEE